jgi:hypothetical protein
MLFRDAVSNHHDNVTVFEEKGCARVAAAQQRLEPLSFLRITILRNTCRAEEEKAEASEQPRDFHDGLQ